METMVYFQLRSFAPDFFAPNGEIESFSNVSLQPIIPVDSSSANTDTDTSNEEGNAAADILSEPNLRTRQLNDLASNGLPVVQFALSRSVIAGWHNHPDNPPSAIVEAPKNPDADGWQNAASALLSKLERDVKRQHLFSSPFFALSALRLSDGSHILPSSPVLLSPNTSAPIVEGSDNFSLETMQMSIPISAARLRCRISLPDSFSNSASDLVSQVVAVDIFVSEPLELYYTSEGLISVHRAANSSAPQCWKALPLTDSEFTARLLSVNSFRRISSIGINDISPDFFDVDFNVPDQTLLINSDAISSRKSTIETYIPDYLQHSGIEASTGCSFSGRTTLCDLTLTLPAVPHISSLFPCKEGSSSGPVDSSDTAVAAEMEVVKNGLTLHSSRYSNASLSESDFPKWLFIPEPDAKQLSLTTGSGTYIIPLQKHPLLNGSFYWCGSLQSSSLNGTGVTKIPLSLPSSGIAGNSILQRDSYTLRDAIWRSVKDSPYLFPDSLFSRLDVGRVVAICRAFRASGLVATTAPTAYLFTTSGIFLLKEVDNGEFRDAGLIANYILNSPDSINRRGNTLEFTDINGNRLAISGTTVKPADKKSQVSIKPQDAALPIEVITRPLKLDSKLTTKLWCIALEGAFVRSGLTLYLYGSDNLINWKLLAQSNSPALKGLYTPGLRFARLKISGFLHGSLSALSLTY